MFAYDNVARVAHHRNDVKVPVDPQPWADNMYVFVFLGHVDGHIAAMGVYGRLMLLEGVNLETRDHALCKKGRAGSRAKPYDMNSLHLAVAP